MDTKLASSARDVSKHFLNSVAKSDGAQTPYPHWILRECIPNDMVARIMELPFEAPDLHGESGRREVHNKTRKYFDAENRQRFPVCATFAEAFQAPEVTSHIERFFGTDLQGSYLRIEFAQDTDGFWLEPHTDLGVKLFTMLLYMSPDESHKDLGTDIYDADKQWVARSPFEQNAAMVFIPSDITYHGFEARPIEGVRTSIIVNYVTDEWRAREQLAFPDKPIGA